MKGTKGARFRMNVAMEGKVVIVTGAASGDGLALAQAFAESGAAVMLTDVRSAEVELATRGLGARGFRVGSANHDVCQEASWEATVAACIGKFGRFDILVNTAGIEETGLLAEFDIAKFRRMLDVNLTGVFLGLKHGLRAMRPGGAAGNGGAILSVSSITAVNALPCLGPYGASKAAIEQMTKVAAVEAERLAWGIRVNCLSPGFIDSDLFSKYANNLVQSGFVESSRAALRYFTEGLPVGRMGETTDLVGAALFLSSTNADCVTGECLHIDGTASIGLPGVVTINSAAGNARRTTTRRAT